MKDFRDLVIWKEAHKIVLEIYRITKSFPDEEKFGLISQMRRAAVSIPANICEGNKRNTNKDFRYFLNISESSIEELKYYAILSKDIGYITKEVSNNLFQNLNKLSSLIYKFKKSIVNGA